MALKAMLDKIEDLSSDIQAHYVEKDGKFFLDVTTVDGLELSDPRGLKSALSKEKDNASKAKKELSAFADIDPVKAREALAKIDEIAGWTPDANAKEAQELFEKQMTEKLEKERKTQLAKFEEEQNKLTTRNGLLEKELQRTMIDMAATTAISDAGGVPELLLHKVTSAMRMHEADGKFQAVIVDESGTPQLSTKAGEYQKFMSVEEYVAELKENEILAPAFKGTGASGTGTTNSSSSVGGKRHVMTEKNAADYKAWQRADAAAKKDGEILTVVP